MRSRILKCAAAMTLFVAMAVSARLAAQSNYGVVELGELGGTAGAANGINDRGWITGTDNQLGDLTSIATLWVNGSAAPLGTLSGGPNSAVAWPVKNNNGVIVGISELPDIDPVPGGEFFSCWPFFAAATPSGLKCKGFRWQNGQMTALGREWGPRSKLQYFFPNPAVQGSDLATGWHYAGTSSAGWRQYQRGYCNQ